MNPRRARDLLASFYVGGAAGSWLAATWSGFTEFPFREVGAILWPILIVAITFFDG